MKSEALRNIRTMRQIKTGLGLAPRNRARTTNSLSKTGPEVELLESLTDRRLQQVLQKERKRFAARQASVAKSRNRLLRSREQLAMTINRNHALTELRHKLQQSSWQEKDSVPPKGVTPSARQEIRQVELTY